MRQLLFTLSGLLTLLAPLLAVSSIYAIEDPDNGPLIEQATAFQGVLQDGDLLIIVMYRVDYDTLPAETIASTYVARFLRNDTELNSTNIYPFNNRGYGLGVFSFYWTPTEVTDDSIEFENPNAENYIIRFQGKPSAFPGAPPSVSFTNIIYNTDTPVSTALREKVIELAKLLEQDVDWLANNVDLISETGGEILLTNSGGDYFANTVPNLPSMGTQLFTGNFQNPSFSERDFDLTEANRLENTLTGTPIGDGFDALGDLFNVDTIYAKAGVAILIMIAVASVGTKLAQSFGADNAGLFGALTVGLSMAIFARIGMLTLETAALAAFLSFGAVVFLVILQRSG